MDIESYNKKKEELMSMARKKSNKRKPNMTYRNRGRVRHFKSKFEATIHEYLKTHDIESNYEADTVEYMIQYKYTPDFPIKKSDGTVLMIEAKGIFEYEDRRKHVAIKKQHPDLDIRFVFYSDYKLNKRAKMRYSGWCEKHGFQYAIKTIPDEWIQEIKDGVLNSE